MLEGGGGGKGDAAGSSRGQAAAGTFVLLLSVMSPSSSGTRWQKDTAAFKHAEQAGHRLRQVQAQSGADWWRPPVMNTVRTSSRAAAAAEGDRKVGPGASWAGA